MSTAFAHADLPRLTRDAFFLWAETQDVRYEFDGLQPVAMAGGTMNHSRITQNLHAALRDRLRGTTCESLGPDAGVATIGDAVRYPDAVITCTKTPGQARLVSSPVAVFDVLSPSSGRIDRIDKLREYAAVATVRRYVILEYTDAALTVYERADALAQWTATALMHHDTLAMPEFGIEIPVSLLYDTIAFPPPGLAADGEQNASRQGA